MGDFKQNRRMHQAVCSECKKRCEVPFKPTGDKPVYCSQCFSNQGGARLSDRHEGRDRGRDRERPRFQDKRMFDAVCDKCKKRFELPFRPTGDKPVYCNECFDRGGNSLNKNNKEQFDILNAKLDKIIKSLIPDVLVGEEKKEKKKVVIKNMAKGNNSRKKETKKPKKDKKK